ncbi:MAG: hypothetical protein HRT89_20800, partial [Lentisphaeria bacterium]|nr:hypothetical protein [Lentisphaeria bacterium]
SFSEGKKAPAAFPDPTENRLKIKTKNLSIRINPKTGLVDSITTKGGRKSLVKKGAFQPIIFNDLDHSWTSGDPSQMTTSFAWADAPRWKKVDARFKLASKVEAQELSPLPIDKWGDEKGNHALPVRIIEDGDIRIVVEVMFVLEHSAIIRHYIIGKKDDLFEIRDRVLMNHKDKMLKVEIPLAFKPDKSISEALYSAVEREPTKDYTEHPNQRWVAVTGEGNCITTVNTGSFAHNITGKSLCLNVMRTPAYSSFGMPNGNLWTDKRFAPRHDQGEHEVRYQFMFSKRFSERQASEAAQVLNTAPYFQIYYPQPGVKGKSPLMKNSPLNISSNTVQIVAVKKAEKANSLIVRLLEVGGKTQSFNLSLTGKRSANLEINPYELKTLKISKTKGKLSVSVCNAVEGF